MLYKSVIQIKEGNKLIVSNRFARMIVDLGVKQTENKVKSNFSERGPSVSKLSNISCTSVIQPNSLNSQINRLNDFFVGHKVSMNFSSESMLGFKR